MNNRKTYYPNGASIGIKYIRIVRILNEQYYNRYFNYDSILGTMYYKYQNTIKRSDLENFMVELKLWGFVKLEKKGSRTPFRLVELIPERMLFDIVYHDIAWWWKDKEKMEVIKKYRLMERENKIRKLKERIK